MKSGLSFNRAVSASTIRRCWPIWAVYLGYLVLNFSAEVLRYVQTKNDHVESFLFNGRHNILSNAVFQAQAACVAAVIAVMILFAYLYSSRGNTLMNSLPITRESMFFTVYLTGLVPMLLCQLLTAGITMLLTRRYGIEPKFFLIWLACSAMALIAFYGFAVFCAMLTGNIVILPLVYAVLNLAAAVFEICVKRCLGILAYGMTGGRMQFAFLSPFVNIQNEMHVVQNYPTDVHLTGLGMLAAYAAAGLGFAVLAMLLYRKRRMETVSDFVAIPVLKPIFRICMGLGGAVVFAVLMFTNFFVELVYGAKAAWLMALLLVIGAVLGWIAAEMMIRRSLRVRPLPWKGLAAICAVCILTVVIAEMDVTGFERRVPKPEDVLSVEFYESTVFSEEENIRAVTELHSRIIREKALYDGDDAAYMQNVNRVSITEAGTAGITDENQIMSYLVPLNYRMKDGSILQRLYTIWFYPDEVNQSDSLMGEVRALLNSAEGIRSRMKPNLPMEEQYVSYAVINRESTEGIVNAFRLNPQEMVSLWNEAMLPDAEDGHLSLYTIVDTEENLKAQTNLRIDINLFDQSRTNDPAYWYHSYRVFTSSERCLKWIAEHTDLDWTTMDRVYEEQSGVLTAVRPEPVSR